MGCSSMLPHELVVMGGAWLKEAGAPSTFFLPVGLCQGWGGKGLPWVLSSLAWQVGAEEKAGCGQARGPRTCQRDGCRTCWLCLARAGVQRAARCSWLVCLVCLPQLCRGQSWLRQGLPTDFATVRFRICLPPSPLPPGWCWGCCEMKGMQITSPRAARSWDGSCDGRMCG